MKNKQKLAILGGVLVVIAVFLSYGLISSTIKFFGGTKSNVYYEEEINLGAISNCSLYEYTCPSGTEKSGSGSTTMCCNNDVISGITDDEDCADASGHMCGGKCRRGISRSATQNCAACTSGYYKNDGACTQCPGLFSKSNRATSPAGCYRQVSAGQHVVDSQTGATGNCPAGTIRTAHNAYYSINDNCTSCGDEFYSEAGSGGPCLSCANLPDNYYCNGHVKTACGVGEKANATHTGCVNDDSNCPSPYSVVNGKCVITVPEGKEVRTARGGVTSCPAGSHRIGSTTIEYGETVLCEACSIGTYQNATGAVYCKQCEVGKYNDKTGQASCKTCDTGYIPNEGRTACIKDCTNVDNCNTSCKPGKYLDDGKCLDCPQGKACTGGTQQPISCTGEGQVVNSTQTACVDETCKEGWYRSNSHEMCTTCPKGKKCAGGNSKPVDCPDGYYQDQIGQSSCKKCDTLVTNDKTACLPTNCAITAVNNSKFKHMSINESVSVTFNITGDNGCNIGVDASRSYFSGATTPDAGKAYNYTPTSSCVTGSIKGCIRGTKICSNTITIELRPTWSGPKVLAAVAKSTYENAPKSASAANVAGKDYYYDEGCPLNSKKGVYENCNYYYRGCGGGGGSSAVPHCYVNGDDYKWEYTAPSGYTLVENVTKEENCRKEEEPACYKDSSGEYHWGKYATTDGYEVVPSIKNENACKKPSETEETYACYKKDNDYTWASSQPEGYELVPDKNTPESCAPAEEPACYLYNGEFTWGPYKNRNGYILLENITSEDKCKSTSNACYKDKNGNYVWGDYENNNDYEIVPGITSLEDCAPETPVPITDINVSKLVYAFMTILMAFGIGFIYYASVLKKNN